jgi:3-hydroxyisobutyrate dehydrogenase-like beta-hydroxyacid dehydrogenase
LTAEAKHFAKAASWLLAPQEAAMNQRVAVVGTGRMGSALASALFNKGFATTVWNRTAAKTEPLAKLGLRVAPGVLDAVNNADVVIVNITNYDSTTQLLRHPQIESALSGKILIQLTTGTPDEAREMESWSQRHAIEYLDGAILGNPIDIGKPQVLALYSGSEALFNRVKPILLAFGDNATFVGKEIGHASALDMAALAFGVGAMFRLLQGFIVYETENLPVDGYMHTVKGLLPVLETVFSGLLATITAKSYDDTQASLDVYAACPRELIKWCRTHGVNHSFADPQLALMDKAIRAGKGHVDFAYLYEIMKKSSA